MINTAISEKIVRRCTAPSIAASAFLLTLALPLHAQIAVDRLEMQLHPERAETRTGILRLRNEGTTATQVRISLEDWQRSPDGSNRFSPVGTVEGSCGSRVSAFPKSLALEPGESQTVRVDYAGALPRECWSAVIVETPVPREAVNGRTLMHHARTAMKVYVTPTNAALQGDVESVAVQPNDAERGDTLMRRIEVTFVNSGTMHSIGKTRLEIRRDDNSVVDVLSMPAVYALPGSRMISSLALPKLKSGRYVLLATVDFGGTEVAAGLLEYIVP